MADPTVAELQTQLTALSSQMAEMAALKTRADGQSQTIGSLQGQLKKLEEKLAEGNTPSGTPDKKTPVEQQISDLKKSLASEKRTGELKRLETAIADHLSDKVISKKVARDLAKQQVGKFKAWAVGEEEAITVTPNDGDAPVNLVTHIDALLETDLADYRPAKANPSRDGLTGAAATRMPAQAKGYHTKSDGTLVIHSLETKK